MTQCQYTKRFYKAKRLEFTYFINLEYIRSETYYTFNNLVQRKKPHHIISFGTGVCTAALGDLLLELFTNDPST